LRQMCDDDSDHIHNTSYPFKGFGPGQLDEMRLSLLESGANPGTGGNVNQTTNSDQLKDNSNIVEIENIRKEVTWNWAGGMHDVAQTDGPAGSCIKSADPNAFASLVNPPTNSFSITINKTSGAYFYMCTVATHCQPGGMWGVITIGGTPSSSAQPGGATGAGAPSSTTSPKSLGTKSVT
ncbi:23738_t:CDS:2, partial [Racocetra persica]